MCWRSDTIVTIPASNMTASPRAPNTYVRLALWSGLTLEARSHRWVPVNTHSTPVPPKREEAVGGLTNSTSPMTHTKVVRDSFIPFFFSSFFPFLLFFSFFFLSFFSFFTLFFHFFLFPSSSFSLSFSFFFVSFVFPLFLRG